MFYSNLFLQSGSFMVTTLTPNFKRDCGRVLGNCRSLSLVFVPGKLLEITGFKIRTYWNKGQLPSPHCYCKRQSCLAKLLEFREGLRRHENYSDLIDCCVLFEIPKTLVRKCYKWGGGNTLKRRAVLWIYYWLEHKTQVGINGQFFQMKKITTKVL